MVMRDPTSFSAATTRELRWFGHFDSSACNAGVVPGEGEAVEHTRDRYAPLGKGCGLKLRSRRLEIKLRNRGLDGPAELATGHRFQGWSKWILERSQRQDIAAERWLEIDKYRELSFLEVGQVRIQVERSDLRTDHGRWWTIALELSGDLESPLSSEVLLRCSQQLNRFDGSLDHCFCGSYPEWIESPGGPTPTTDDA